MLSLLFLSLFYINSYAQVNNFEDLRGIPFLNSYFFELSGTLIHIQPHEMKLGEIDAKEIKEQLNIEVNLDIITKELQDSTINITNLVIEGLQSTTVKQLTNHNIYYIFQKDSSNVEVIHFSSFISINPIFVKNFIDAYLNDKLSDYVVPYRKEITQIDSINSHGIDISRLIADSINFAGQTINLENRCSNCIYYYSVPNCVQNYKNHESMNWSIFDSLEDAKRHNNQWKYIMKTQQPEFSKLVSDTTINVIFEGIETPAHRIIRKELETDPFSQNRTFCYYFIAQKVRGKFVSTIFQFNIRDEKDTNWLPPLASEIMSLEPKDKD